MSIAEARRLAVAAQGLGGERPASVGPRDLRRSIRRQGLLQIDSVNVLVRAHYMPLFSRLGPYDREHLHVDAYRGKRRRLFEYWAHEASLVPVEMHPLFRWRMAEAERGEGTYKSLARFARERAGFVAEVLREVEDRGPLAASELTSGGDGTPGWWGWSDGKLALEYLFWAGRVTTLRREEAGFARIYDLPERVLHEDVLGLPTPPPEEAQRTLLRHAAGALGVATEQDLREYFRLPVAAAKARLAELAEAGDLLPVEVEGWRQQAYLDPAVRVPRRLSGAALLSPFDPLVSERARAERLFDFHYRIEIYTPAHKRQYGYYCLPFLMGDRVAGRLDLRADRPAASLVVTSAHAEAGTDRGAAAERLAGELRRLAGWLGLAAIAVERRGDLAPTLGAALAGD